MTVRAVVTASGRVQLERHRLRARRRSASRRRRRDRWRARSASSWSGRWPSADRANNAVLQERDGRWTVQGDPTEGALIVAARKAGLEDEALDARFERVGEVPFSSERKLMTHDSHRRRAAGAPARLHQRRAGRAARALFARAGRRRDETVDGGTPRGDFADRMKSSPARRCARSASPSARCRRTRFEHEEVDERVEQDLVFPGLIGMIDPPREEAKEAVARAKAPAFAR